MRYFVTGTDTGVGKTHVTAALVTELRRRGRAARAIKPLETGWLPDGTDADRLALASEVSRDQTVWQTFAVPRSPKAAARAEHRLIDCVELARWCTAQRGDPLFVEGAGGWLVPIAARTTMRDLAATVADAALLVGRATLGTINHTLLTVESIAPRMPLTGVVLSRHPDESIAFARENADEIAELGGVRVAIYPDDQEQIVAWFDAAFGDDQPTQRMAR